MEHLADASGKEDAAKPGASRASRIKHPVTPVVGPAPAAAVAGAAAVAAAPAPAHTFP